MVYATGYICVRRVLFLNFGGIISLESHGFLLPSHNTLVRFRSDMGGIVIFKTSWKAALITESDLDLRSLV